MELKTLYKIIRPFRAKMLLLLVVTLAASLSEAGGLSLLIPLLNAAMGMGRPSSAAGGAALDWLYSLLPSDNSIMIILGMLVALICLKAVCTIFTAYVSSSFVWTLNIIWNQKIFNHYMSFSYPTYMSQKHGDLINNLIQEPATAAEALARLIAFVVKLCLSITMYAFLLLLDWKITTILTSLVVLVIFPLNYLLRRRAHRIGRARLGLSQQLASCTSESITGFNLLKAFGLEKILSERFHRVNQDLNSMRIHGQVVTAFIAPSVEVSIVVILVFLIYGMTGFESDRLMRILPQLAATVVIANRLMSYFSDMLSFRVSFNYLMPSLFLVHKLTSEQDGQEDLDRGATFSGLRQDIVFKDVSFRYKADEPLFDHLDITLPRGKTVAFIGSSGVGKSTIASLLLGLYTPCGGEILVNGQPLTEYSLRSWRSAIGYVSQETMLFNLSIRENIRLGKIDASDEEIERAARTAAIHDFIATLPQGYDTLVGECGIRLSGGQRQRIAIARSLIRDPSIYIFDEATSALDTETEKVAQSFLEQTFVGKTAIIIAHRLSTIQNADIIYSIKNGTCVQVAKEDLMLSEFTINGEQR